MFPPTEKLTKHGNRDGTIGKTVTSTSKNMTSTRNLSAIIRTFGTIEFSNPTQRSQVNMGDLMRNCIFLFQSVLSQVSSIEPRKELPYFPLYWLLNRDPYNGL